MTKQMPMFKDSWEPTTNSPYSHKHSIQSLHTSTPDSFSFSGHANAQYNSSGPFFPLAGIFSKSKYIVSILLAETDEFQSNLP